MLNATRDLVLPTTITGSCPRPAWFTEGLHPRPFKDALGDCARRIAFYKCVAITLGANVVRRELGLPEAPVPAADPRFA